MAAAGRTVSAGQARVAAGAMDTVVAVVPGVEAEAVPAEEAEAAGEVEVVMVCV